MVLGEVATVMVALEDILRREAPQQATELHPPAVTVLHHQAAMELLHQAAMALQMETAKEMVMVMLH